MRNFGATAPAMAPEPVVAEETGEGHSSNVEGVRKTAKQSTQWPEEGSSSLGDTSSHPNVNVADKNLPRTENLYEDGFFGENQPAVDVDTGTRRLAKELDEFVATSRTKPISDEQEDTGQPTEDAIADLQLQTARKLRQLLPANRELLHLVQERNWIPLLLGWLNLNDRPAVQVEALLALTNIAELCAHHSAQTQSSAAVAAAAATQAAATASAKAGGTSPFYSFPPPPTVGDSNNAASTSLTSAYPYTSLLGPAQGQVAFPPLSFSQKMTPEALAALDATLTNTIQQTRSSQGNSLPGSMGRDASPSKTKTKRSSSSSSPVTPLPPLSSLTSSFPPTTLSSPPSSQQLSSLLSSASSLSGPSSGSPFLPPPTPVLNFGGSSSFPQQLSASSQHLLLRHADAIPTLISLLSSPNREVYEQAMWILGSIAAGDSPASSSHGGGSCGSGSGDGGRDKSVAARDVILAAGVMKQMLRCLEAHPQNLSLQRIGSWTLSNLVEGLFQQSSRGKSGNRSSDYSSSDEINIETLLPVLRRLLLVADPEVLSYACWTLSHLCDGPSSHIAAVVTTKDCKSAKGGLVPKLVDLLTHPSWRVTKPALRTIGNIVCAECSDDNNHGSSSCGGQTDYTEVILDCGAVPRLKELVTHSNREIQKEACWTLSNIAAGTVDQIQAVIDSQAIPPLVKLVGDKKTDQEVRSEACWVVLNATSCGSDSQIEVLVDEGCVSVLGVLLGEPSMVMMALEGLERVLQVEETRETVRREQLDKGDIADENDSGSRSPTLVSASLIEKALEKHNSSAVTKRASRIWKQHFVYCALCNKSFSKHRATDATFCEECKCYVCSKCDCSKYHLSYQEELWADEEPDSKKSTKKSKKQKKKEKQKQKKAKQQLQTPQNADARYSGPTTSKDVDVSSSSDKPIDTSAAEADVSSPVASSKNTAPAKADKDKSVEWSSNASVSSRSSSPERRKAAKSDQRDEANELDRDGLKTPTSEGSSNGGKKPPVDFVTYLQETGSIIALAKLMDALDFSDGSDYEIDDNDVKLIHRHQQVLNEQATN